MQTNRSPSTQSSDLLVYAALIAMFAIEAIIFFILMETKFAPFFPPNSDQTSYFMDTYELIERTKIGGLGTLAGEIISPGHAAGVMFTIQGAIMGLLFGATRTIIASTNLIYFIALQSTLFFKVRRKTREPAIAWMAIAFLLTCGTVFMQPGGIFDYRIDFSALCLYGIWCCLIIDSRCLLKSKLWVIAVGVLLVMLRFFTIAYIGAVLGGLLIYALGHWWRSKSVLRREAARRIKNIFFTGISIAVITLPIIYFARDAIYNYYIVGHFLGNERYIRAAEMGITAPLSNLVFYPRSIERSHLTHTALWLMIIVCVGALLYSAIQEKTFIRNIAARLSSLHNEFVVLGLCIFIPLVALTIDVAKSPVVGGIVLAPILLVVVLFLSTIWPAGWRSSPDRYEGTAEPYPRFKWLSSSVTGAQINGSSVTACVFAIAAIVFLGRAGHTKIDLPPRDLARITEMNEKIAAYIVNNGITNPTISFDRPVDYLNQGTVRLFEYENEGRLLALDPRFGHGTYGIFATPRDVAMRLWAESDINILTDPIIRRNMTYPISTKIREYWADMRTWADKNRVLVYSAEIMGVPHRMYAVAPVGIAGIEADNWITSNGVTLEVAPGDLARWPFILLTGAANYSALKGVPHAQAVSKNADGSTNELPVTFERAGEKYSILIDGRNAKGSTDKVEIRLTFDRHFVASPADSRKLVILAPQQRRMLAAPPPS